MVDGTGGSGVARTEHVGSVAVAGAPALGGAVRGEADGRTRILDAALQEFANRGYDGATMAAVARRAGVTQPLVHYHFSTKHALWCAAVGREIEAIVEHFGGTFAELGDLGALDRGKVLVRRLVLFMAEHPEFGRIMAYEGVQGGPRLEWILAGGDVAAAGSGRAQLFDHLLAAGIDDGWVKPLPVPHVVSCILASSAYFFQVGATVREQYGLDASAPEVVAAHADTVVELVFHGIACDGGAA